jgi:ferrochelatase
MTETASPTTGILLMGYGGPDSLDAIGPFMANLMGREPSEELVERARMRYLSIGGQSPLPDTMASIREKLAEALSSQGFEVPVAVGMRYWHPFISQGVRELLATGVRRIVGVSMSPFEAKITCGAYRAAVQEALAGRSDVEYVEAPLIAQLDEYAELVAAGALAAMQRLDNSLRPLVVFCAHSLPESDLIEDDAYVRGFRAVVDRAAEFLAYGAGVDGVGDPDLPGITTYGNLESNPPWVLAYQSKGERPGAWLGPDLEDVIDAAAAGRYNAVAAVPVGFVTDHLETLYDLDIIAAERALDQDMEFSRAPVPNDSEHLVKGLVSLVRPLL